MSHTGLNISKLDKSKTKFKAIEINKVYKGSSVESQKTSGSTRQHGGLQVLGKVGPTRRMPPPVHLPSLKSEHGFSDPVSLVPTGGSGWGGNSKEEDKTGNAASTTPVFTTSSSSTSKSGLKESINGTNSSSGQLWSNITSGKQGLMNKKQFQEDFPELAANPEDKVHSSPKKDDTTDLCTPLGPCLKPQNMLSWREGGGRKHVVDEDEEKKETSDHNKLRPSGSSEDDEADDRRRLQRSEFGYPPMPPYMSSQAGIPPRLMKPPVMGQMMGRMPGSGSGHPPSHMMYGPMVPPQFMFHPRPGYGPPPPFPGYLPPPPRPHMPYPRSEQGFHHGMPAHMRMPPTNGGEAGPREVIVKDQSLKEFDKISLWEGGWASKVTEVDYSKKLEFSDDEDNTSQKPSSDVKPHQSPSKEGSNFKPMKIHYDEDLFTFNSKAHGRERNQARDYKEDNEQVADDFRSISDWSDDFRGCRSDDQFKNPSKSLKSEDYYYEDVYDKEERYEAFQARTQNKPTQSGMRFAKKDREIQDSSEPTRSPKIGFEEYHPIDDRRYNSADSKRDKLKYENRHDAIQFEGSSNRNSESPDQYEYSGDAKDYSTEEKASRHHDSTPEHNRLSSMTSFSKSPVTSDKFEKPVKSSTDEEKTDKIAAAVSLKEKTSPFDKASAAVRHVCPPPITSKYARQDPPAPSKYISLKKTSRIVSSDSNTSQTFNTPGRNIKNFPKQFDLEESLEATSQSVDNGSSCGGRKNWADSIDEEEELELKKNVWENTYSKKNRSSHLEVFEDELIKQFQNVALNKTGSQNSDSVKQQKCTLADDKPQISKDVKATFENYKEYSSKYLDRQRYEDKHSTRKQPAQEDQEDGYLRRNTTRVGNHGSSDAGYQEFTRSGVYSRSSHSQQFRRSNYHVLTSRKTNASETDVTEKDKSDFESKQKSEHPSRSDSNPWRIAKNPESAREDNRDSANHERSEEAVFEDKHVKVESVKADEGAGDGVCKEVELHANMESLKEIHLPPVHHKVLMTESVWKTADYKESYEDREMRNNEADVKEDIVGMTPVLFKADQNKEKLQFVSQAKQKSESDQSPTEVTTTKSFPAVHQPPPNVWLNRQKQEQRKVEERPQLVKNVWKSKNENLQKNFPAYPVDPETKSSNKETSDLSQSGTPIANPAPKKPPALMDLLIAKPPTALLKESQLLSSGDILDSDWNSTDNLSYMGRRSERGGYSRTPRGSGNQRRRMGGDQPEGEGVKDDERDNKSRRGHPYRHGDSNRRNRGLTRGYKGRVEYEEENDQQDVGRFSDDRRRSKSGYSRGEARSLTSDRKLMPGSLRGRRRGNKTSISSGTGVTSNCATNESDIGNEEWETASESSDVLQNTHSQRPNKSHKDDDDRLNKLNRQFTESHHENKDQAAVDDLHGRSKKNDGGYLGKNSRIQPRYQSKRELVRKNSFTGKTKSSLEHMVDKVSSVNQKHLIAPNATVSSGIEKSRIESTTTGSLNKFKQSKVENTETAKPKYEREKKDILATIDVNNYASVVVVDNHPEVSIDDPSFLFEKNEGFQEVTSRRTLKSKMKAAQQEEALKKAAEQQQAQAAAAQAKKLEKDAAKLRPAGTTSIGDNKLQRNQKLLQMRSTRPKDPKRVGGPLTTGNLARKFSISEDDRNAVLPKIENWNNDMAKSIPPLVPSISHSQTSSTSASASVPATTTSLFSANSETTPAIGSFGVTPVSHHLCAQDGGMNTQTYQSLYSFPVENWEKQAKQDGISKSNAPLTPGGTSHIFSSMSMPISEWSEALLGSKQPVIPTLAGDQNGLLNMPTMDQRDHEAQHQSLRESSVEKMSLTSSPKPTSCHDLQINENDNPSCEAKAASLGVSVTGDEGRAVKKPEGSSSVRAQQGRSFESIDIHSSIFKYRQGEDSSDIKLDFAFDASLQAKIPEAEKKTSDVGLSAGANLSVIAAGVNNNSSSIGCSVTSSTHLPRVEMMSASDEDLGYKLAQVKNVWDRESTINYEQGMVPGNHRNPLKHAAPVSSSISVDMNDQIRQQQASSYLSGLSASGNDRVVLSQVDSLDSSSIVSSNSLQQQTMAFADAEMTFKDSSVDTYLSEQPNVCKVKPQLQASLATRSLNQFSGVASPPTPAQQHLMITFGQGSYAFGSQLLTPDCGIGLPFGQHAYLAAPATQTPLLAPLALASQPSLFLGHTPNVQSDMYGAAQYRNLFGLTQQPQQQQSTIVVSSATSTLMSTAIKNQHQQYSEYYSSGSKQANALSAFPYGQLLGNSPIMQQPSQIGLPYDTAQYSTLQPDPTIMPPSNSQIVGSHLVPQRNAALHGLSSSTYYPQTLLQQSCFQQQRSGSHLQGSFQQYQLSAAFNMQPVALSVATGNGTQLANATALNFQAQQPLANQSQLKHSAPPFKPSSQRLALSPNGQKFSASGMMNGSNLNKNSLLSYHLQQQQDQQNASMLSSSFLLQQNLPNNIGSGLSNHSISIPSQYQLFTQQQQQQLQQLQQTIQLHQQQQQHNVPSGSLAQQQQQPSNYSGPPKDRYGMTSAINQQSKYPQSLTGPSQMQQKFEQFGCDNAMDSQQAPSNSLLQNKYQSCKTQHVDMLSSSVSCGSRDAASSKLSPTTSSAVPASLTLPNAGNVTSQTCDATSNVSSTLATSASSPTSFKSSGISAPAFPSSSGNKWTAGSGFAGNLNFQGNQQHQSFAPPSDRFNYGYLYSAGPKSDISRDNSQSSRTSLGSKSVTVRNVGNKGETSGGGTFHPSLLKTGGNGNVGVASRAERSGTANFYSLNAKDIKDLQAEERKKAMMDIQSFLNPENKPPQKLLQNPQNSSSPTSYSTEDQEVIKSVKD